MFSDAIKSAVARLRMNNLIDQLSAWTLINAIFVSEKLVLQFDHLMASALIAIVIHSRCDCVLTGV
jgi:hypothetical protein